MVLVVRIAKAAAAPGLFALAVDVAVSESAVAQVIAYPCDEILDVGCAQVGSFQHANTPWGFVVWMSDTLINGFVGAVAPHEPGNGWMRMGVFKGFAKGLAQLSARECIPVTVVA